MQIDLNIYDLVKQKYLNFAWVKSFIICKYAYVPVSI